MSLQLAQSGVLLLRIDMSGIGAEADMRRCAASIASVANDPSLHLAAKFAVMHNTGKTAMMRSVESGQGNETAP